MDTLLQRLNRAYDLLRDRGVVHTQADLANMIGKRAQHLNNAFRDQPKRCTLGLMKRIADTFPDIINSDYMLTGEGDVAAVDTSATRVHVPVDAAAGYLTVADASLAESDCERLPYWPELGQYDFTIRVQGRSMEPVFFEGDLLACRRVDPDSLPDHPIYAVLDTADGFVTKQVTATPSGIHCHSVNADYPDFDPDPAAVFTIARVVALVRDM